MRTISFSRRLTVYDLSGELEYTFDIEPWEGSQLPELVGIFPDGSFLVSARVGHRSNPPMSPMIYREVHVLRRFGPNWESLDSLGYYLGHQLYVAPLPNDGEKNRGVPFARSSSAGVIGGGYYVLDNKDAMIAVFDTTGTLLHNVGPDTPPDPVRISRRDRDLFSGLDIDSDHLPQFYPFYSDAATVDSTLWVLEYVGPVVDHLIAWTVYSQEGEALGRVKTTERLSIHAVVGDVVVVVHHDGLGVQTVQLRRIVRRG